MAKRRELFRGSAISRRYRYFPEFEALSSGPHSRQYRISRAGAGRNFSGNPTYRDLTAYQVLRVINTVDLRHRHPPPHRLS